jgi:hypothetical protein
VARTEQRGLATQDVGRLVTGPGSLLDTNPADDGLAGRMVWLEAAAE